MPVVPTLLILKITQGPDVIASQEITFDDGTLEPLPLVGDQIVVSTGEQIFRGTVAARDFDYTQFLAGNEGKATFVITIWADAIV
ncbi:MAG TPA: hypothetical protein VHT28_13380 [Silvibacterium sp.]|jgi:hypothetical protein|nr:hypothetical protein [Silvibacterium sp.]